MPRIRSIIDEARRGIASAATPTPPAGAASEADFRATYDRSVDEVLTFLTPEMQHEMASHNRAWGAEQTDFEVYLRASWTRYFRCYAHLAADPGARTVCDVGGFWGALPIALCRMGYEVTMTESLKYYSRTFDHLFDFIRSNGVRIVDHDPFDAREALAGSFDFVTVMAVLEHYPHSLRAFMDQMTRAMATEGRIYLEVPNIAFWDKRVQMLFGRTPLVPLADIYESEVPFIGHHHEFTRHELRELARLSGLEIVAEEAFNYTPGFELDTRRFLTHPLRSLAFLLRRDCREILGVLCRRPSL